MNKDIEMSIQEEKFNPFNYSINNHINMILFILTYLYNKIYNINNNDDKININLLYDFMAFYVAIIILIILIYKFTIG
jgi:hypothetical protein